MTSMAGECRAVFLTQDVQQFPAEGGLVHETRATSLRLFPHFPTHSLALRSRTS